MNKRLSTVLLVAVFGGCIGAWWYSHNNAAARGERAFQRLGCGTCHYSGGGPNLTHIVRTQDPKLLEGFIADPPKVYGTRGMKPLNEGYMLMPDMHASTDDAHDIVAYLRQLDKQDK